MPRHSVVASTTHRSARSKRLLGRVNQPNSFVPSISLSVPFPYQGFGELTSPFRHWAHLFRTLPRRFSQQVVFRRQIHGSLFSQAKRKPAKRMSFKAASTGHRLDRVPLRRQQLGPSAVRLCLRLRVPRCLGVHLQPRADRVLEIWSENEKRRGRFRKTDPASHGGMLLSGWLRCLTRLPITLKGSSVFESNCHFLISHHAI